MAVPKLSVVMIAYSAPEFIPEAVESILDQSIGECEVILVDDGSSEDIKGCIAKYRDRVHYIRRDNGGPSAARNTGIDAASGQYVAFADSDDIHLPYRLAAQTALLDVHPAAALTCADLSTYRDGEITEASTLRERNVGIDEGDFEGAIRSAFGAPRSAASLSLPVPDALKESRVYRGTVPALIASRHIAWAGVSMFRRSVLNRFRYDFRLRYWEDWCQTSRLSKHNEIVYWDAPVILYRQHGGQITKQSSMRSAQSYRDVVFRVWKDDPELRATSPELLHEMIRRATLRNASYAADAGQYKRAQIDILHYIREAPFRGRGYLTLARTLLRQIQG